MCTCLIRQVRHTRRHEAIKDAHASSLEFSYHAVAEISRTHAPSAATFADPGMHYTNTHGASANGKVRRAHINSMWRAYQLPTLIRE